MWQTVSPMTIGFGGFAIPLNSFAVNLKKKPRLCGAFLFQALWNKNPSVFVVCQELIFFGYARARPRLMILETPNTDRQEC